MKWIDVTIQKFPAGGGKRCPVLFALLVLFSGVYRSAAADTTPELIVYKEIHFGEVLFVAGSCTMNHTDGTFTAASPDAMCGGSGKGTPGHYLIISPPNTQVRIRILQRDNEGDGFVFIPAGELSSDTETQAITPNVAQDISSGATGGVNIRVGGSLFITNQTTPGTTFNLIKQDGIEWSILP